MKNSFDNWWNSKARCQDEIDSARAAWNAAIKAASQICRTRFPKPDDQFASHREVDRYGAAQDCATSVAELGKTMTGAKSNG